jgi:hypothetical protein
VTKVYLLGHVQLRDARTDALIPCGIRGFRRDWWKVKGSGG